MNVFGEIQPEVVGWIVEREVVGACVDEVQVGGVHEFPAGGEEQHVIVVSDAKSWSGIKALYR